MARGYLGFRIVEAVFCSTIVVGPLALLILSHRAALVQLAERAIIGVLVANSSDAGPSIADGSLIRCARGSGV